MKKTTIFVLFLLFFSKLVAQTPCGITFEYDNAGNRTKRLQCFSLVPNNPSNNAKNTQIETTDREQPEKSMAETSDFTLFPNPSSGVFQLSGDAFEPKSTVVLMDSKGRAILQRVLGDGFFDISGSPAGVYFLKIQKAGGPKTIQFIKE